MSLKHIIRSRSDWKMLQEGLALGFPQNYVVKPEDHEFLNSPRSEEVREALHRAMAETPEKDRGELLEADSRRNTIRDELRSLRTKIRTWREHGAQAAEAAAVYCGTDNPQSMQPHLEIVRGCEALADDAERKYLISLVAELEALEEWIIATAAEATKGKGKGK